MGDRHSQKFLVQIHDFRRFIVESVDVWKAYITIQLPKFGKRGFALYKIEG